MSAITDPMEDYIKSLNASFVSPPTSVEHLFLFALHDIENVTATGPPVESPSKDPWPIPSPAMKEKTKAERALVVRSGISYCVGNKDAACVFEESATGRKVYLGSEGVSRCEEGLSHFNVCAIVNCAGNSHPLSQAILTACGVGFFKQLDFVDRAIVVGQDNGGLIERGADAVAEALANGQKGNVLVHCVAGVSRSASVVMAFLVKHRGYTLLEAALSVKRVRNVAYPNWGFWMALRELEVRVRGECSIPEAVIHKYHLKEEYPLSTHVFGEACRS